MTQIIHYYTTIILFLILSLFSECLSDGEGPVRTLTLPLPLHVKLEEYSGKGEEKNKYVNTIEGLLR